MSRPVTRFAVAAVVGLFVSLLFNTYVVVALVAGLASAVVLRGFAGRPLGRPAVLQHLQASADCSRLVATLQAALTRSATVKARAITELGTELRNRLRMEGVRSPLIECRVAALVERELAALTALNQEAAGALQQVAALYQPDRSLRDRLRPPP